MDIVEVAVEVVVVVVLVTVEWIRVLNQVILGNNNNGLDLYFILSCTQSALILKLIIHSHW